MGGRTTTLLIVLLAIALAVIWSVGSTATVQGNTDETPTPTLTSTSAPATTPTPSATPISNGNGDGESKGVDPLVAALITGGAGLIGAAIGAGATLALGIWQQKAESERQLRKLALENRLTKYGELYVHLSRYDDRGTLHPLDSLRDVLTKFHLLTPFIDQKTRATFQQQVVQADLPKRIEEVAPPGSSPTSDGAIEGHSLLQQQLNAVLASATDWIDRAQKGEEDV